MHTVPVSVVIPCFRSTRTIARALASVHAQTRRPREVILIDDYSGDDTPAVLAQLAATYRPGWVRVIALKANGGAGCARNAGWAAATQPWLAFLDADDLWHPRKLEIQHRCMLDHPDAVLSGHAHRVICDGDAHTWDIGGHACRDISPRQMLLSNRFVTPSVMLRRDIVERFDPDQRYMEDHLLWLRIVCSGQRVVRLDAALAALYKASFGVSGLSSHLRAMEVADLRNMRRLRDEGFISGTQARALQAYSLLKYMRRLCIQAWRNIRRP